MLPFFLLHAVDRLTGPFFFGLPPSFPFSRAALVFAALRIEPRPTAKGFLGFMLEHLSVLNPRTNPVAAGIFFFIDPLAAFAGETFRADKRFGCFLVTAFGFNGAGCCG
jgi:hypothetical protein